MAGSPKKRPSMAAATVPEYQTSSPKLEPELMPEITMSGCSLSKSRDSDVDTVCGRPFDTDHPRSVGF